MILTNLTAETASPRPTGNPAISFPFLWQDARGAIWLRSQDGSDVCEKPAGTFVVGQRNPFAPPNSVAWQMRMTGDIVVTLRNIFPNVA